MFRVYKSNFVYFVKNIAKVVKNPLFPSENICLLNNKIKKPYKAIQPLQIQLNPIKLTLNPSENANHFPIGAGTAPNY